MPISRFVYDPWELPAEQRQTTFVGREQFLKRFLGAIREQEGRATVQHYILTGPRGIGKTTLLLVLRDRIRQDPEISAQWFCVQLREEEYYIHKQRDLWQLVLQALAVNEKLVEAQQVVDQAQDIRDEEKSSALLVDGLRSICNRHGKRLVLLIDNFDHIFPNTAAGEAKHRKPDSEYRAFRKRLSTETFLMLIATSVKLFEDIYGYDQGFFHFFSPIELPELSREEVAEMLRRLAQADGNAEFLSRLERSKVTLQTLCVLTGGNPRLITMLYHILAQREMGEPVQALWETVAGLTPMLRQELADMPRQQSKTLDALLRLNGAAAPAEISKYSRLPLNVVTTQLGRLKAARYVALEGGGKGRKATYRVADQMFSVWYSMRYVPVGRRRIELFTDFLRAWFSSDERKRLFQERWERFHTLQSRGMVGTARDMLRDAEYHAASLDEPTERREEMVRLADAYITVGDLRSAAGLFAELAGSKVRSATKFESLGYSVLAVRLAGKGDLDYAIKSASEALSRDPHNAETRALFGMCLAQNGRFADAIEHSGRALRSPKLAATLRALVLTSRGYAKLCAGDERGGLADFDAVLELPGAPSVTVSTALTWRGLTKEGSGDTHGATADYTALIGLKTALVDHLAKALLHRGGIRGKAGDSQGAVADFTALVELKAAPPDNVAIALFNRGVARDELGDTRGAIADYTLVVEAKGTKEELLARALLQRGAAKANLSDFRGAIADYTAVVGLDGTAVEHVAKALLDRGLAKGQLDDRQGAIVDYTAAVELNGAPTELVADGILSRGVTKTELGDSLGAIDDYAAVAKLRGSPSEVVAKALIFRGELLVDLDRFEDALRDFELSIQAPNIPEEIRLTGLFCRGLVHEALREPGNALADYVRCAQSRAIPFVHDCIRAAVRLLFWEGRDHEAFECVRRLHELEPGELPLETRLMARLDIIRQAFEVASLEDVSRLVDALLESDPEELRARLQFLKPGLELAKTHDESVLADLPEDERKIAKEIAQSLAEAARQPMGKPPSAAS
jgi:tetratricopeptide (TPR) repeat protein